MLLKLMFGICTSQSAVCQMCHSATETIFHILSACPMLASTDYLRQHNSVASLLHKNICDFYGIVICDRPWLYTSSLLVVFGDVKTLWNFNIRTDHAISNHRPDTANDESCAGEKFCEFSTNRKSFPY